jgi:transposase
MGAFYRHLRPRLVAPIALTATAHRLAILFYQMWITAGQCSNPEIDYYEQKYQELMFKNLT